MMDKEHSGDVRIQKQKDCEEYISLIPYTEKVTGITLKGFKYPLEKETLRIGISRGISNELEEEEGLISIEEGILIVCISKD
jgi:thiamine pyrophosphokinase